MCGDATSSEINDTCNELIDYPRRIFYSKDKLGRSIVELYKIGKTCEPGGKLAPQADGEGSDTTKN